MKFFTNLSRAFNNAKWSFIDIMPGIHTGFNGKVAKLIRTYYTTKYYGRFVINAKHNSASDVVGSFIGAAMINKYYRLPMRNIVKKGFKTSEKKWVPLNESHLLEANKSWFNNTGKLTVKIIYHEGNKRGAHIDMHFSNGVSFVIDVRNKPLANDIKFNNEGVLTQKSVDLLMKHVLNEFDGDGHGSRVFHNYDHNPAEASMQWKVGQGPKEGYGSGPIRQVIHESEVHVMWNNVDSSGQATSIYMPGISPDRYVYFHKLYKGVDVAKMGLKGFKDTPFEDRLHLKMIDENKYKQVVNPKTTTVKYDGASAYIVVNKHGTLVFSPRISSKTGHRIDYTGKMPTEMINTKSDISYKGMGELLFKKDGKYLSSTEIGGLLNSNKVIPDDIETEYRLYRIDKMNRNDVRGLDFFENRNIQESVAGLFKDTVKVPDFITPKEAEKQGLEGIVGTAPGDNVFNGFKMKFRDDFFDWKITKVNLKNGPSGKPAGVVLLKSLESGKEFKLGPGQLGNESFVRSIMSKPNDFIGKVMKVDGFRGHEGRAAKFVEWHMDK